MSAMAEKPGKVGFILVGLFEGILGLFCWLLMGFMLLGLMVGSRAGTMTGAQIIPAVFFYLAVGVVFIVFGIGTILVKRWARKLMLIFAWVWLVSGVLGSISMLFMMPVMEKAMNAGGKLPPGTFIVVAIIMAVVFLLIFLLLPGIFILFYGRKKAKAVVEAWDTKESWTDKCPAPVLAVSLLSGLGVVFMVLFMPFYHFVLPFFGTFLYGWPGALLCLIAAAALAYCAWGFYRLKTGAWWVFLATILFWGVSSIWTFSTKNILDIYEAMQMPENSLEMLKQTGMLDLGSFWGFYMAAIFGVYFIYLLFIRKYFKETR